MAVLQCLVGLGTSTAQHNDIFGNLVETGQIAICFLSFKKLIRFRRYKSSKSFACLLFSLIKLNKFIYSQLLKTVLKIRFLNKRSH